MYDHEFRLALCTTVETLEVVVQGAVLIASPWRHHQLQLGAGPECLQQQRLSQHSCAHLSRLMQSYIPQVLQSLGPSFLAVCGPNHVE